ncbi:MAG: hypothetical protein PHS96_05720 [Anaerolineales bacterium]|nr:hypothetical protein [Anaerolineales bacterium]
MASLAAISALFYLGMSALAGGVGFPLDDAWIHQTYARNLVQRGEWAFAPGEVSAGSTAPLWSLLLSLGYLLGLGPYPLAFTLGWASLLGIGWLGAAYLQRAAPSLGKYALWAGAMLVFEWHLVWAAVSGMETLLTALLILLVFNELARESKRWGRIGLVVGLGVWLRPDCLILALPVGIHVLLDERTWGRRIIAGGRCAAGALALLVPYLVFIRQTSGLWWPNTFYAKQAEYSLMQETVIWKRFLAQALQPLVGVGALLLPGVAIYTWNRINRRAWSQMSALIWALTYLGAYAWRLPATYQHGRYQIPVMPMVWLIGLIGALEFLENLQQRPLLRLLSRVWVGSSVAILLAFWLLGARAYTQDVGFIQGEMVASARWIAGNTEARDLIAAHDIGALGFFGERQLIDLAGLVNPEVIAIIRDEEQLASYLDSQGADYLVAFPGWYPNLVKKLRVVYRTGGAIAPALGGENMVIYRWKR